MLRNEHQANFGGKRCADELHIVFIGNSTDVAYNFIPAISQSVMLYCVSLVA